MRDVALAAGLVEVLELLAGELGVLGEVEVAAVGDALELRPADREQVLDVGGAAASSGDSSSASCSRRRRWSGRRPRSSYQSRRACFQYSYHCRASAGGTKNSISICSNSRVRKMKLPGVISLRNDLPTWAMPNGGFLRENCRTFLKLMKMPCAVSGRR